MKKKLITTVQTFLEIQKTFGDRVAFSLIEKQLDEIL
jgi:hypothetical protein